MSALEILNCRVCNSDKLEARFSLGAQLVSDFPTKEQLYSKDRLQVPINLVQCANCTLLQQEYTASQDFMYTRHYWYRSGMTQTMKSALSDIAYSAIKRVVLDPGDIVLDIGSNDGTLLRSYPNCGIVRVGVEPATNLQEEGSKGIDLLINDFWSKESYVNALLEEYKKGGCTELQRPLAKIITAIGMFYDLPDPNQFIADIANVLHPDGIFIAQLMCAKQMYQLKDVGNLAHEHLEFYTLTSLGYLLGKHGLRIVDIEENNVNGGSYRLYIKHITPDNTPSTLALNEGMSRVVNAHLIEHNELRLQDRATWLSFFQDVCRNRDECVRFIEGERRKGYSIYVYGASTKGNVILQFYGLGERLIEGACDKSIEKIGRYTANGIPIVDETTARKYSNYFFVLPYTFIDEFMRREYDWASKGGKFIVPLPQFQVR